MGEVFAGRYELVDLLGAGGMGSVWRVFDHRARCYVAAKVLRQGDASALLRFVREQGFRIHHPNVVTPRGWAGEDERVLFTMDLVRGGTLSLMLQRYGRLPPQWVAVLTDQILAALVAVHEAGLIHRDIKPGNIMLEPTGRARPIAKLMDFGVAVPVDEPRLTRASQMLGTPGYLAPEVFTGADPEPRHDLYSTGVLAAEMLSGRRPDPDSGIPAAVPDGVPAPLWDYVRRLGAWSPNDRPASGVVARKALAGLGILPADGEPPADPAGRIEVFDIVGPLPNGWGPAGPAGPAAPGAASAAAAAGTPSPARHPGGSGQAGLVGGAGQAGSVSAANPVSSPSRPGAPAPGDADRAGSVGAAGPVGSASRPGAAAAGGVAGSGMAGSSGPPGLVGVSGSAAVSGHGGSGQGRESGPGVAAGEGGVDGHGGGSGSADTPETARVAGSAGAGGSAGPPPAGDPGAHGAAGAPGSPGQVGSAGRAGMGGQARDGSAGSGGSVGAGAGSASVAGFGGSRPGGPQRGAAARAGAPAGSAPVYPQVTPTRGVTPVHTPGLPPHQAQGGVGRGSGSGNDGGGRGPGGERGSRRRWPLAVASVALVVAGLVLGSSVWWADPWLGSGSPGGEQTPASSATPSDPAAPLDPDAKVGGPCDFTEVGSHARTTAGEVVVCRKQPDRSYIWVAS